MSRRRRHAICVCTSKPSLSLTPSGGGGSLVLLCPNTGCILSSLRASGETSSSNSNIMGMSSLSLFPDFSFGEDGNDATSTRRMMLAYGGNPSKRDDKYGMLLSLRSSMPSSSSLQLHWKCRLPEAQLSAGLLVSPCGYYIVGGASSGSCFVWSALGGGGALLCTFQAHYRSVTTMAWWNDYGGGGGGTYLLTGGADGMVHAFSLMDLVDRENKNDNNNNTSVAPVRTWSVHQLPVTALQILPSAAAGRIATAAEDGQVVVVELCSQQVLATIQMPHAIRALAWHGGRLYAGALQGSIYTLDLDLFAMHQTTQLGMTVQRRVPERTTEDKVFALDNSEVYRSELHGHERPITAMAVLEEQLDGQVLCLLVSGDEAGEVRIWDLESRGCVRVIRPWSHATTTPSTASSTTTAAKKAGKSVPGSRTTAASRHPVTSILVVPRGEEDVDQQHAAAAPSNVAFASFSKEAKSKTSLLSLMTPLQRYKSVEAKDEDDGAGWIQVPFLRHKRDNSTLDYFDTGSINTNKLIPSWATGSKRAKTLESKEEDLQESSVTDATPSMDQQNVNNISNKEDELLRLQRELEEAKSTIERWETVNNKLMTKLKQQQQQQQQQS